MTFCELILENEGDLIGRCPRHRCKHSVWIATDPSEEAERHRRRLDARAELPATLAPGAIPRFVATDENQLVTAAARSAPELEQFLQPYDAQDGAEDVAHRLVVTNRGGRVHRLFYRDEGGNEIELALVPAFKSVIVDAADGSAWVVRRDDGELAGSAPPLRREAVIEVR